MYVRFAACGTTTEYSKKILLIVVLKKDGRTTMYPTTPHNANHTTCMEPVTEGGSRGHGARAAAVLLALHSTHS